LLTTASNTLPKESGVNLYDTACENEKINLDFITILVNNKTVILTGRERTYQKRRLIGEEVWNTPGVARILNDLQVTEPETAGPGKILEETL